MFLEFKMQKESCCLEQLQVELQKEVKLKYLKAKNFEHDTA